MVSGDWLVPRLGGVPHYAKPPWIYWCIAASFKVFGIHEWTARLPSALAGVVTALTVFALGRQMAGPLAGMLAALVLVSSFLFFSAARLITPDMMLTACITLSLYCFWRWWGSQPRSSRWLLGFYVALAIAFLDKGPVGIVVPFLAILGFVFLDGKIREFPKLGWMRGLLVVGVIALPWFLLICHLNPDLYDFYLKGEIKDRMLEGRGRGKCWYYFLMVLPIACWPWTALAVSAVRRHFQWWRRSEPPGSAACFLLSWAVFPFILFTLSSSKLPTYILPLLAPISLMLGLWLAHQMEEEGHSLPIWSHAATWALLPGIGLALKFATWRTLGDIPFLWFGFLMAGLILSLSGWVAARFLLKRRFVAACFIFWWSSALLLMQMALVYMPGFETELRHNSSWRTLTRLLNGKNLVGVPLPLDLHPSGQKPRFARPGDRVVMYEFSFWSSGFYLMKERNEVVPLYGGSSLWEIGRDINAEAKLTRDDLLDLLKGSETVYVFSRPRHLAELRRLSGMELPLIKSVSGGKYEVALFSNH